VKRLGSILLLLLSSAIANAQNGYTFNSFSIGAGLGGTVVNDFTVAPQFKYAFNGNLNYYFTPFLSLTGEMQVGKFAGGNSTDISNKQFLTTYAAALLHVDLQAGELIDYSRNDLLYGLKDLYVGTGVGYMANAVTYVQPIFPGSNGSSFYDIVLASTNFVVPLRIGYDYKIYNNYDDPQIRLDLCYNVNTVFGQGIDGYVTNAPIKFYNYISFGVKIGFGNVRLYRKPLDY